jgi:ketosteroid isomerase-like protein
MISQHTRTVLTFSSLVLLMGFARPAAAQETQDTTQLPESLRTERATLSAAYSALDAVAVAGHFTDDGMVDFQGQSIAGRQAVGGWFAEMFGGMQAVRSGPSTFAIGEDEITERATYVVSMPDGDQSGSSETIWRRQEDGSWKVARLIVL